MNRRGFIGRLFGMAAALVGVKAVEAKPPSRETMIRPPWIERVEEVGGYRLQGRIRYNGWMPPIFQPEAGSKVTAGRNQYHFSQDGALLDFEVHYSTPTWMAESEAGPIVDGPAPITARTTWTSGPNKVRKVSAEATFPRNFALNERIPVATWKGLVPSPPVGYLCKSKYIQVDIVGTTIRVDQEFEPVVVGA